MILKQIAAPAVEPVSLDEAKLHMRVDIAADDTKIQALITAAREYVEKATRRSLITQEWRYCLDSFPAGAEIKLPRPPLVSVDEFTYTDSGGTETDVAAATYSADTDGEPGRIVLDYGETWPSDTLATLNPVKVEFTAGYGDAAADVPQIYRQAILLLAAHWYEQREAATAGEVSREVPFAVQSLIMLDRNY